MQCLNLSQFPGIGLRSGNPRTIELKYLDRYSLEGPYHDAGGIPEACPCFTSKTINLPHTATKEDCADALLMVWKYKLKGITLYGTGNMHSVFLPEGS
jgi:hypothetical protein